VTRYKEQKWRAHFPIDGFSDSHARRAIVLEANFLKLASHLHSHTVRLMAETDGRLFRPENGAIFPKGRHFGAQTACREGIFEGIVRSLESRGPLARSTPD